MDSLVNKVPSCILNFSCLLSEITLQFTADFSLKTFGICGNVGMVLFVKYILVHGRMLLIIYPNAEVQSYFS